MPLQKGSGQETISSNIAELMRAGNHSQRQAVAIAYRVAGKGRGDCAADGYDMSEEEWDGLTRGWEKFLREERQKPAHGAHDATLVHERIAFDRASVRSYDQDGRLRISEANISKANVCEYMGDEIPDWEKLGLEPKKIYRLLRDPDELKKAAKTYDGVQLMIEHIPVNADDHRPNEVIGSVGTGVRYDHPYLKAPLMFWAAKGIKGIESNKQKELSSGYHYRADMTPGHYEGQPYDGVMRDIRGNHVALVQEGRVGSDVVVGDGALPTRLPKLKELDMPKTTKAAPLSRKAAVLKGALLSRVPALLATDAKAKLDTSVFDKALAGLTARNYASRKARLKNDIASVLKPHLAADANVDELLLAVDAFEKGEECESGKDAETAKNSGVPPFIKKKMEGEKAGEGGEDAEEEPEEEERRDEEEASDEEERRDEEEASDEDHRRAHDAYRKVRAMMRKRGVDEDTLRGCDEDMGYTGGDADEDRARDEDPSMEEREGEEGEDRKRRRASLPRDTKPRNFHQSRGHDSALVTKQALDSALRAATAKATADAISQQRAIYNALSYVRPMVGELAMAFDSADAVYKKALAILRPDLDLRSIHPSAYKTLLSVLPTGNQRDYEGQSETMGMDSSGAASFFDRFGADAKRLLS